MGNRFKLTPTPLRLSPLSAAQRGEEFSPLYEIERGGERSDTGVRKKKKRKIGMKKFNKLLLVGILVQNTLNASAQTYQPVDNASSVKFVIQNSGMATDGKFSGLAGNIKFNAADLKGSSFAVSIEANSVNTEIDVRDEALRTAAYLDAKKFPQISLISKQITATGTANTFMVKATVTVKGIHKDISFPFKIVYKEDGILLTGDLKINRRDFTIGEGSLVLSDAITVSLSVFAKKI